jgi:hypothetical protein
LHMSCSIGTTQVLAFKPSHDNFAGQVAGTGAGQ